MLSSSFFHLVSLLFIAMLASAYFPPCFLTLYSSDRSLLPFLKSWFLNYSCMFTFYGLAIASFWVYLFNWTSMLQYGKKLFIDVMIFNQQQIERVQRKATRLIKEISHLQYEERLLFLKLLSLYYRRRYENDFQFNSWPFESRLIFVFHSITYFYQRTPV